MTYATPPVISASTLLGATQLDIYGDDLIDLEGRSRAPAVPFERVPLTDTTDVYDDPSHYSFKGRLVYAYDAAASEHMRAAYALEMLVGEGTGTPVVEFRFGSAQALLHSVDVTSTTVASSFDLSSIGAYEDSHGVLNVRLLNAEHTDGDGTATAAACLLWLEQIKLTNADYVAFRADPFHDGETVEAASDFSTLRTNVMALHDASNGGRHGFRARQSAQLGDYGNATSQTLFTGYGRCNKGGRLYVAYAVGYGAGARDKHTWIKATYNGSDMGAILHARDADPHDILDPTMAVDLAINDQAASSFDLTAEAGYANVYFNQLVPITVSACTDASADNDGVRRVVLLYVAEIPSASHTGWTTPWDCTEGASALGDTADTSASRLLVTLATNAEFLAGDQGASGYATLNVDAATGLEGIGTTRIVERYPIHRSGRQHWGVAPDDLQPSNDFINPLRAGEAMVQRLYQMRAGDTIIARARDGRLRYGPAASPLSYNVKDYNECAASYDEIDAVGVDGLNYGSLYYVEVAHQPNTLDDPYPTLADYLEERWE